VLLPQAGHVAGGQPRVLLKCACIDPRTSVAEDRITPQLDQLDQG